MLYKLSLMSIWSWIETILKVLWDYCENILEFLWNLARYSYAGAPSQLQRIQSSYIYQNICQIVVKLIWNYYCENIKKDIQDFINICIAEIFSWIIIAIIKWLYYLICKILKFFWCAAGEIELHNAILMTIKRLRPICLFLCSGLIILVATAIIKIQNLFASFFSWFERDIFTLYMGGLDIIS